MSPDDPAGLYELTIRLWSSGDGAAFEDYIAKLLDLLPRHRGRLARRVSPLGEAGTVADAVLVLSFPDSASIDGFLKDPLRADLDDTARAGVRRSLVVDGRKRPAEENQAGPPGEVVEFPGAAGPHDV